MIALNINGKRMEVVAEPGTPLLWVLRDYLALTGTKYGCGMALCGACTVHVNGKAIRSCVTRARQCDLRVDRAVHPCTATRDARHTNGLILSGLKRLLYQPRTRKGKQARDTVRFAAGLRFRRCNRSPYVSGH